MKSPEPQFEFVGNNVAVDFTNTEIVDRGRLTDLLGKGADLVQWARAAGFNMKRRPGDGDLSAARELRAALKAVFQASIDRQPAERKVLAVINGHLANHCPHRVLRASVDGAGFELAPTEEALAVPELLANLAYEAATLLASSEAERLKRCGNRECVLMFVDSSRSHKRRWCSMETCGNRAKAAKHYRNRAGR